MHENNVLTAQLRTSVRLSADNITSRDNARYDESNEDGRKEGRKEKTNDVNSETNQDDGNRQYIHRHIVEHQTMMFAMDGTIPPRLPLAEHSHR